MRSDRAIERAVKKIETGREWGGKEAVLKEREEQETALVNGGPGAKLRASSGMC